MSGARTVRSAIPVIMGIPLDLEKQMDLIRAQCAEKSSTENKVSDTKNQFSILKAAATAQIQSEAHEILYGLRALANSIDTQRNIRMKSLRMYWPPTESEQKFYNDVDEKVFAIANLLEQGQFEEARTAIKELRSLQDGMKWTGRWILDKVCNGLTHLAQSLATLAASYYLLSVCGAAMNFAASALYYGAASVSLPVILPILGATICFTASIVIPICVLNRMFFTPVQNNCAYVADRLDDIVENRLKPATT